MPDLYREALKNDAHEAVLGMYSELLYSNPQIDPADSRSRLQQYNNGHPPPADQEKLHAAEQRYVEVAYAGGTPLEAAVAAKMVLNNDREQQKDQDVGATREKKELSADEKLDQHIEQTKQQQPEVPSAEQELEKYMQLKNRELAGPNPYQDLQKKQDLGL